MKCTQCGAEVNVVYMCDEDPDLNNQRCGTCFETTPCGQGKHDEGCETMCIEQEEEES